MIGGKEGSSLSRKSSPSAVTGSMPVVPLLSSAGSGLRSPLLNSETVIHQAAAAAIALPPTTDAPSSQVLHRLFPNSQENSAAGAAPQDVIGVELGHFRIEERIGVGGMGAVFRAVDLRLQRFVALKLLSPNQAYDQAAIKRFENEARAAARLDHENIAKVYFIGEERGLHFIAFEYVVGSTIRDLIRRSGRIAAADTVNYAMQVAHALKHTSAMGVVHRDIKPSNIIVTLSGRVKLVDLGLARKEQSESAGELTMTGTTLGTFDYISPEQAKDPRSVDVRSDIYSLGCTMYHMLTGQPPYPDGTALQKLLDHQRKDAPNPQAINPEISDELAGVVRRMMNSDRNKRYQTPEQLLRDLSYVANQLGLRGVHPEGLVWIPSHMAQAGGWRSQVGWIGTVIALLVAVVVLQQFPQLGRGWAQPSRESLLASNHGNDTNVAPNPNPSNSPSLATNTNQTNANIGQSNGITVTPHRPNDNERVTPSEPNTVPNDPPFLRPENSGIGPVAAVGPSISKTVGAGASGSTTKTEGTAGLIKGSDTTSKPDINSETSPSVAVYAQTGALLREYRSFEAACSAAEDGSVIELRFSGRRIEKPTRLTKKNVTIRAARGHAPILAFKPTASDVANDLVRFLTMQSGPVNIVNVLFELDLSSDATAPAYSLFGMVQPTNLQLSGVGVTLLNPKDIPCSVVSVGADAVRATPDMPRMPLMPLGDDAVASVEMSETLVRGAGSLAQFECSGRMQLTLRDTALALSQDAIRVTTLMPNTPEKAELIIRADHLTAVSARSFLRLHGAGQGDRRIAVQCHVRNSLFEQLGDASLVRMDSTVSFEDSRRILSWNGERNFYSHYEQFWRIDASEEDLEFQDWLDHWGPGNEVGPNNLTVIWHSNWPDEFAHSTRANFQLLKEEGVTNAAVRGASDGNDAGSDSRRLPDLPTYADDDRSAEES